MSTATNFCTALRSSAAHFGAMIGRIGRDNNAVSLVEFACVAPVFLTLGLYGAEVAHMASTKMQVSQVALSVADNASRLGQTDNSSVVAPTINETDIAAVLQGALTQASSIGLEANGRIILSSLEYDDVTGKQYIHWQRCVGDKDVDSAYGNDTNKNGINGPDIDGMGFGATKVTAQSQSAVMYVEVYLDYQPIAGNPFGGESATFKEEAAFIIRDDRNLTPGLSGTKTTPC